MNNLGKPIGIFSFKDSDNFIGSYIQKSDLLFIFDCNERDIKNISFIDIGGIPVIDELELQKIYYKNELSFLPYSSKISFDEHILNKLIKYSIPNIEINSQIRMSRFLIDLELKLNNKKVFVEFDGPSHFSISCYGYPKHDPFYKKRIIEDKTGVELINWPYWIPKCKSNIQTIFNKDTKGIGALWSTKIHFGDFVFSYSSDMIIEITNRFNAFTNDGCGYFYEQQNNKPEHPIINKILNGKSCIKKILPNGYKDSKFWVPSKLHHLI